MVDEAERHLNLEQRVDALEQQLEAVFDSTRFEAQDALSYTACVVHESVAHDGEQSQPVALALVVQAIEYPAIMQYSLSSGRRL